MRNRPFAIDLGQTPRLQRFDLSRLLGGFVLRRRNLLLFQQQQQRQIHFFLLQTLELDDRLFPCRDHRFEESFGRLAGLHLVLELLSVQPLLPKNLVDSRIQLAAARLLKAFRRSCSSALAGPESSTAIASELRESPPRNLSHSAEK